jgi:hypothetical protein
MKLLFTSANFLLRTSENLEDQGLSHTSCRWDNDVFQRQDKTSKKESWKINDVILPLAKARRRKEECTSYCAIAI